MKRIFLLASVLFSSPAYADWFQDFWAMIGYDLHWRHIKVDDDFTRTKGIIPENYLGQDVYLGARFESEVGVYAGWSYDFIKIKESDVGPGTILGSVRLSGNAHLKTTAHLFGPYLEFTRYWCATPKVDIFVSGGLALLKPSIGIESQSGVALGTGFKGKTRMVPRFSFGGQRIFYDWLGVRLKFQWEATSNTRIQQNSTSVKYKLFTDSILLMLGVYGAF